MFIYFPSDLYIRLWSTLCSRKCQVSHLRPHPKCPLHSNVQLVLSHLAAVLGYSPAQIPLLPFTPYFKISNLITIPIPDSTSGSFHQLYSCWVQLSRWFESGKVLKFNNGFFDVFV